MTVYFHHLAGEDLLANWPAVRAGLIDNVQYHGEITAPERVWQALQAGGARCFVVEDGDELLGHVVLTVEGVGVRADPYLYVWQANLTGLLVGDRFPQYMACLEGLARECGLTTIRMNTTRPGWGRVLRQWAKPVLVEYERKVPDGQDPQGPAA